MNLLNPWALAIAAAVVPALLILYFLKLRRREQRVPSTLLWKRAVQDLQVNAPFQRLRKNLLLFLQLLILALAIFALARPIVQTSVSNEDRVVILIDRSASMNTREADGQTRLEQAKEQAVRLAKTLNRRAGSWSSFLSFGGATPRTEVMVIAFSDRATIISPFTTNTSELEDLIRRIEPSDGRTDMSEALKLAEAYMAPPAMLTQGMEGTPVPAVSGAKLVLISDGRIPAAEQLVLKGGSMERIPIGATVDNVGVTALRAVRNYESPEILEVFLTVRNFGPEPVTTDVALYTDGTLAGAKTITLGGRPVDVTTATAPAVAAPGEERSSAALSFPLTLPTGALLEVRLSREDALAADNRAWAVVPPPRKLRVLVITEKNNLLNGVLPGLPLQEFPFITPAAWEANAGNKYESDGTALYDVVVFDKHRPKRFPVGNYLFLGAVPPLAGFEAGETLRNHPLVWWDDTHAVLRHVALEYVYVGESTALKAPEEAEVLVEGPKGPALVRASQDGRNCLVLTFPVENSTWWSKRSFPIFIYNALRYLGGGADAEGGGLRPGQTIRLTAAAGVDKLTVIRPVGPRASVTAANGAGYYGGTERVGVYEVEGAPPGRERFAVNLEDDWESNVRPAEELRVADQTVGEMALIRTATPEVWRWFIGVALGLALLEWWIYNRRVMV